MRSTSIVPSHRRKVKDRKTARGMRGGRSKLRRTIVESINRSLAYAYRDRRAKKRDFRSLWITRISSACRERGVMYSRFIAAIVKAGIKLDRKQLAEMVVNDPTGFDQIVEAAKKHMA